jgi:hypothetical protein
VHNLKNSVKLNKKNLAVDEKITRDFLLTPGIMNHKVKIKLKKKKMWETYQ